MMVTAPPLWSYGPGPSSLLIKDANMTDTTASSDAKQSQPAASSSGSELDRLRELAEQAMTLAEHQPSLLRDDPAYRLAEQIPALLAERQQDRQRIADLEDSLEDMTCNFDAVQWSQNKSQWRAWQKARYLLSPEAQPSSGGDE